MAKFLYEKSVPRWRIERPALGRINQGHPIALIYRLAVAVQPNEAIIKAAMAALCVGVNCSPR